MPFEWLTHSEHRRHLDVQPAGTLGCTKRWIERPLESGWKESFSAHTILGQGLGCKGAGCLSTAVFASSTLFIQDSFRTHLSVKWWKTFPQRNGKLLGIVLSHMSHYSPTQRAGRRTKGEKCYAIVFFICLITFSHHIVLLCMLWIVCLSDGKRDANRSYGRSFEVPVSGVKQEQCCSTQIRNG